MLPRTTARLRLQIQKTLSEKDMVDERTKMIDEKVDEKWTLGKTVAPT